jgi:hypothetical protein
VQAGLVVVVSEGDFEARSMGSYAVRVYSDPHAARATKQRFTPPVLSAVATERGFLSRHCRFPAASARCSWLLFSRLAAEAICRPTPLP